MRLPYVKSCQTGEAPFIPPLKQGAFWLIFCKVPHPVLFVQPIQHLNHEEGPATGVRDIDRPSLAKFPPPGKIV